MPAKSIKEITVEVEKKGQEQDLRLSIWKNHDLVY